VRPPGRPAPGATNGPGRPGQNEPAARAAVKVADLRAALDKARKPVEEKIGAINNKLGQRVVPVGDAFVKMRRMVVGGTFPG